MRVTRLQAGAVYPRDSAPYAWLAAAAGLSAVFLPLYELRPNRIAKGEEAFIWSVPALAALLVAALVLLLAWLVIPDPALAVRKRAGKRPGLHADAAMILFSLIQVVLILAPGFSFPEAASLSGSSSFRVSPSSGFWLIQGSVVLAMAWVSKLGSPLFMKPSARFSLVVAGLILVIAGWSLGLLEVFSPWKELRAQGPRFGSELLRHLYLSGISFAAALVIGIAGAIVSSRNRRVEGIVSGLAASVQNIPSLALFGLLLPVLAALASAFPGLRAIGISGIGTAPAILALTAYGVLPILLATLAGLRMVDPGARDAAKGMGMRPGQVLFKVDLPLALPSMAGGARTALVQTIGTATVAALVGAGGMGYFIFQGVGQAAMDMVVLGVVPVVLMSLVADRGMAALAAMLAAKGGRKWP